MCTNQIIADLVKVSLFRTKPKYKPVFVQIQLGLIQ